MEKLALGCQWETIVAQNGIDLLFSHECDSVPTWLKCSSIGRATDNQSGVSMYYIREWLWNSPQHWFKNESIICSVFKMWRFLLIIICDWACKNRVCVLKYATSFDEAYLNIEMNYLDFLRSVVKPKKILLATNLENFVAIQIWIKNY